MIRCGVYRYRAFKSIKVSKGVRCNVQSAICKLFGVHQLLYFSETLVSNQQLKYFYTLEEHIEKCFVYTLMMTGFIYKFVIYTDIA